MSEISAKQGMNRNREIGGIAFAGLNPWPTAKRPWEHTEPDGETRASPTVFLRPIFTSSPVRPARGRQP